VFVVGMGTNTSLCVLYARSPLGERAHCTVRRNRGPNTTLFLRATLPKMHPSRAITLHTAVELHFKCYILIVSYSFSIVLSRTAC
jgi:hypothetical protein